MQNLELGGGERDRTDDLLRARQALSQLSYTPGISIQMSVIRCQKHAVRAKYILITDI